MHKVTAPSLPRYNDVYSDMLPHVLAKAKAANKDVVFPFGTLYVESSHEGQSVAGDIYTVTYRWLYTLIGRDEPTPDNYQRIHTVDYRTPSSGYTGFNIEERR